MSFTDKIRQLRNAKNNTPQKSQCDENYRALTPKDDIHNGDEYLAALDWAIDNDDIRNIAISGPYGSGKSSVIRTYFNTRERKPAIIISLAAFNLESIRAEKDKELEEELEIGILKQLFYHVRANRIPKSRYRKLQPDNKIKDVFIGLFTEILLLSLLLFFSPRRVSLFIESLNRLEGYLGAIVVVLALVAVWGACFTAIRWFGRGTGVKEISILNKASFKNGEGEAEESVFNRNIDEILYFFEVTGYQLVVFEDLDRFDNTNIFVKLRNLNNLLNNYEGIDKKIVFIYAIKDDMFQKEGERTKFFDFIIPVVPYISSTNSGEILRHELQFDEEKNTSRLYDISGKFISLISPYISDMRDLKCICNEFIIFKNTLKGNQHLDLNDTQMFSLIVFKNLYPNDFAQLENESNDSIVRKAFFDKRKYFYEKEVHLKEKRQEQEAIINRVKDENLRSIRELKIVLFSSLVKNNGCIISITCDGVRYSYSNLLDDSFDINILKRKNLEVIYYPLDYGYQKSLEVNNIEKEIIENDDDFFERINRLKRGFENCKEEAKRKIEDFERLMNTLHTYSIRQMIEQFGTDFLSEDVKENDLLIFLLRNGFVDESYTDYINYFHPNSISKDEMNFVLSVRNHSSELGYEYPLKNVSRVFGKLQEYEFKQEEVLNFELIDYVLESKIGSPAENLLVEQLSDHSQSSMSFIKAYVERGNNAERLLKLLCHENDRLWKDICEDTGISIDTRYKYLSTIILHADIDDIVAQDETENGERPLTDFFLTHPDVLERIKDITGNNIIQIIDALKINFTNLETANLPERVKEHIFGNCHYKLNEVMIRQLVNWIKPELVEDLKRRNYTIVLTIDYQPLTDYVHEYFDDYVRNLVIGVESNTEEDSNAVEDILERLFPDNLDLALSVLNKEKIVWNNIEDCCVKISGNDYEYKQKIWDYLFENNQISCTWDNIESYFNEYGESETWLIYIIDNVDPLTSDVANFKISNDVKDSLLYAELPEEAFRKIVKRIHFEMHDTVLSQFGTMKIRVLIEEQILPFDPRYWSEMESESSELRVLYAKENNRTFMKYIDNLNLTVDEVNQLLAFEEFENSEKVTILKKINSANVNTETAQIIESAPFDIPKAYVNAAWQLLSYDEKKELLLNHIEVFENDELSELFSQLGPEYEPLVERKRHKYTLDYSDYNRKLLEKLRRCGYITSSNESWTDDIDKELSGKKKILTGYVKVAR